MNEFLVYIDQNILAHADEPAFAAAFQRIRAANAYLVISHVHLIEVCRSNDPYKFVSRLKLLGPALLRSKEADDPPSSAREVIVDYDPRKLIEDYRGAFEKIHFSLIQAHLPLLKLMGGLVDLSSDDLLRMYLKLLEAGIMPLLDDVTALERHQLERQLALAKEQISQSWSEIDFDEARKDFEKVRGRVRQDGSLHQVPAQDLVERLKCLVSEEHPEFFSEFPRGFAEGSENSAVLLASLCMVLTGLGAIPRTGKMIRGPVEKQEARLYSQILDNHHISEAGFANAFLTCDAAAARLAAAAFTYAGVGTQVWLMKSPLSNEQT